jgi:hypothetical protein
MKKRRVTLAEAAEAKLRAEALAEFLDTWEGEHGALSVDQLAAAAEELGVDAPNASYDAYRASPIALYGAFAGPLPSTRNH